MKNTLYAIVATCTAMLITSGLVVVATAAPEQRPHVTIADANTDLDPGIMRQLAEAKARVGLRH